MSSGKRKAPDLKASLVPSKFGHVAVTKDFFCVRCGKIERFELPEETLQQIDSPDMAGDTILNYIAEEQSGWLSKLISRPDGRLQLWMCCPDCIIKDLDAFG